MIHSSYTTSDSIPETINSGLWITGSTNRFNTTGRGGKKVLGEAFMIVMVKSETDIEFPRTIGCSRIRNKPSNFIVNYDE